MLTGEKRSVRVRATDECHTLALDRPHFHKFLLAHPRASINVLTAISQRLYTTDKLIRQAVVPNVNKVMEEKLTVGREDRRHDRRVQREHRLPGHERRLVQHVDPVEPEMVAGLGRAVRVRPLPVRPPDDVIVSLEAIFLSIFLLVIRTVSRPRTEWRSRSTTTRTSGPRSRRARS